MIPKKRKINGFVNYADDQPGCSKVKFGFVNNSKSFYCKFLYDSIEKKFNKILSKKF